MECDQKTKTPPVEILSAPQITTIRIEWCVQLDLPETFMMLAELPNLVNLHFVNCGIGNLPPEIWMLYQLKSLSFGTDAYVNNNEFKAFPPEIGFLDALGKLNLNGNIWFKKFPPEVARLKELGDLGLRELRSLPENIELIPHLKHLNLVKSGIVPVHIEPLVNRPNGLEVATVDDFMFKGFQTLAEKYPNFSVYPVDSGHPSRGGY